MIALCFWYSPSEGESWFRLSPFEPLRAFPASTMYVCMYVCALSRLEFYPLYDLPTTLYFVITLFGHLTNASTQNSPQNSFWLCFFFAYTRRDVESNVFFSGSWSNCALREREKEGERDGWTRNESTWCSKKETREMREEESSCVRSRQVDNERVRGEEARVPQLASGIYVF